MVYSIEFNLKILDILTALNSKKNAYYTVSDVLKEYKKAEKVEKEYIPILRKRIRSALIKMSDIGRIEKAEEIDSNRKIFFYKFKINKK